MVRHRVLGCIERRVERGEIGLELRKLGPLRRRPEIDVAMLDEDELR